MREFTKGSMEWYVQIRGEILDVSRQIVTTEDPMEREKLNIKLTRLICEMDEYFFANLKHDN